MSRLELEAVVWRLRQCQGRSYFKDHSMDECIEFLRR